MGFAEILFLQSRPLLRIIAALATEHDPVPFAQAVNIKNANGDEGASVNLYSGAKGGTARFILSGNGTFDISDHNSNPVTTGSLERNGVVLLGAR